MLEANGRVVGQLDIRGFTATEYCGVFVAEGRGCLDLAN